MRIGSKTGRLVVAVILVGVLPLLGCGSDGGGKGPEAAAAEYVEAGNVRELEKFMDNALFGIDLFEVTDIETELVSETENKAVVGLSCKIGMEGESVRGSRIEMTLDLDKVDDEWVVTNVSL